VAGLIGAVPERWWDLYRRMYLIRTFEETVTRLAKDGRVAGAHLSIGQEACAVGAVSALRQEDYLFSTHRGHGHALARGCDVFGMLAELLGKQSGISHGRGGSMHVFSREQRFFGTTGIVGGSLPLAVGAGYAAQVRGEDAVSAVFCGDGATAQGVFHESLNLAKVWHVPVVFFCESNGYAELTPTTAHLSSTSTARYAVPHGIRQVVVDGADVIAVLDAAREAVEASRAGGGPSFVEMVTRRIVGHFALDSQHYRDPEDLQDALDRDAVPRFRRRISDGAERSETSTARLDRIESDVRHHVADCAQRALAEPDPEPDRILENVR
jgi:TPP-dependent pyruvate/acetoin dehydrogenase alpha subunit